MLFKVAHLVEIANSLIGIPYIHLGRDPKKGLDCYGLIIHFYSLLGLKLYDPVKDYSPDWWKINNYIKDYYDHDFVKTDKLFCGNVLSIKTLDSTIANHLALYLDVNFILNTDQFIGVHRLKFFVLHDGLTGIYKHKQIEIFR